MSTDTNIPPASGQQQEIRPARLMGGGWTEFVVSTADSGGLPESRTEVRLRNGAGWVDLSITEYTGIARRAKLTSVRLQTPAVRALLDALTQALPASGALHLPSRASGRGAW